MRIAKLYGHDIEAELMWNKFEWKPEWFTVDFTEDRLGQLYFNQLMCWSFEWLWWEFILVLRPGCNCFGKNRESKR